MKRGPFIFGVCAVFLLTSAWMVLGQMRSGYSSIRQPINDLGIGTNAWVMNMVFILCGLLLFAAIVGTVTHLSLGSRWLVLLLSPLGLVQVGLFPENMPLWHFTGATLLFQTPTIAFLLLGFEFRHQFQLRRFGNWLLFASVMILAVNSAAATSSIAIGGLAERVMLLDIQA